MTDYKAMSQTELLNRCITLLEMLGLENDCLPYCEEHYKQAFENNYIEQIIIERHERIKEGDLHILDRLNELFGSASAGTANNTIKLNDLMLLASNMSVGPLCYWDDPDPWGISDDNIKDERKREHIREFYCKLQRSYFNAMESFCSQAEELLQEYSRPDLGTYYMVFNFSNITLEKYKPEVINVNGTNIYRVGKYSHLPDFTEVYEQSWIKWAHARWALDDPKGRRITYPIYVTDKVIEQVKQFVSQNTVYRGKDFYEILFSLQENGFYGVKDDCGFGGIFAYLNHVNVGSFTATIIDDRLIAHNFTGNPAKQSSSINNQPEDKW